MTTQCFILKTIYIDYSISLNGNYNYLQIGARPMNYPLIYQKQMFNVKDETTMNIPRFIIDDLELEKVQYTRYFGVCIDKKCICQDNDQYISTE